MYRSLLAVLILLLALPLTAQQPAAAHRTCSVTPAPAPSNADNAFSARQYAQAESLYAAMPASSAATAGQVRAMLAEHKLDDALKTIQQAVAAHPNDALLEDALGEVRYRRGEIGEAGAAYNRAAQLDPCLARLHFDVYRYMNLEGMQASAQRELDLAYKLAPDDPLIQRNYDNTHRVPLTADDQIGRLRRAESDPSITPEQKAADENSIAGIEARERGDCQLTQPVESTRISLMPLGNATYERSHGAGVDVYFNGKRRRLQLDTGASGIVLSHDAAKVFGLNVEARGSSGGLGDEGPRSEFVSHVDSIRIGQMEFHNCQVRVFDDHHVLAGQDGLIGGDVFRSFLVTLDFPAAEMRLSPLPKRPDETEQTASLGSSGESPGTDTAYAGLTYAATRKDRYVAPEMKDWTKVFRYRHFLIFPTSIGHAPAKLFIMDTGASQDLISPAAAREVTSVVGGFTEHLRGISGEVKDVRGTSSITLTFGNIRAPLAAMTAIDSSRLAPGSGVEVAGLIGFETLRELVIEIDYRDDLVHLKYIPHVERSDLRP